MNYVENFLAKGETVSETNSYSLSRPGGGEFFVHTLKRSGLHTGDEVLIEVPSAIEPCVLIGGNPLELRVESGNGRITKRDLKTGEESIDALVAGDELIIPSSNILYSYERIMGRSLVIRDHCDNFNPDNEPSLHDVVAALSTAFLGRTAC